jgi:anti-sigma-K factor RskA
MDDIHDLTALYIVDALDDLERRRYESHLPTCETCRSELDALDVGFDNFGEATAETVPPSVKGAEMADFDEAQAPPRPLPGIVAGLVAAAAALSVVVAVALSGGPDLVEQVYAADDVVVVGVADTPFRSTQIVYSREVGRALFVADGLPHPGAGFTYQLWFIGSDGSTSAGTFLPDAGKATVVLQGTASDRLTVGLTIEPEGGSEEPTGEMLVAQPLA